MLLGAATSRRYAGEHQHYRTDLCEHLAKRRQLHSLPAAQPHIAAEGIVPNIFTGTAVRNSSQRQRRPSALPLQHYTGFSVSVPTVSVRIQRRLAALHAHSNILTGHRSQPKVYSSINGIAGIHISIGCGGVGGSSGHNANQHNRVAIDRVNAIMPSISALQPRSSPHIATTVDNIGLALARVVFLAVAIAIPHQHRYLAASASPSPLTSRVAIAIGSLGFALAIAIGSNSVAIAIDFTVEKSCAIVLDAMVHAHVRTNCNTTNRGNDRCARPQRNVGGSRLTLRQQRYRTGATERKHCEARR
jgi:hypothetical protein